MLKLHINTRIQNDLTTDIKSHKDHVRISTIYKAEVTINCAEPDYAKFPFDTQECTIFLYPDEEDTANDFELIGFVTAAETFDLNRTHLQYKLRNVTKDSICTEVLGKEGASCVALQLELEREYLRFLR